MKLNLNSFFHAVRYALDSCNYDVFLKVKQLKILEACMLGEHVIGVLPTGYGKSVIFHILPYVSDYLNKKGDKSIIVVISPLNALIEDQVSFLNARGIKAGVLQASRQVNKEDKEELLDSEDEGDLLDKTTNNYDIAEHDTCKSVQNGEVKLLFTHPEAFISCKDGRKLFQSDLYQERVMFCVIDEAHLIYEWGSEFRPDFAKLSQLGSLFPYAPVLALTATAPKKLIDFLKGNLHIKDPFVLVGNLDRANIFINKKQRRPSSFGADSFNDVLRPIAEQLKQQLVHYPLTIIYLPLKWCGYAFKLFTDVLGEKSHFPENCAKIPENCLFAQYHAPQTDRMKDEILKQLTGSSKPTIRVVFATVAIGIGVNIPEVRHVIHLEVPRTLEAYYQEMGRAGRDGKNAKATLFYNGTDIASNKVGMTDGMRHYCTLSGQCLRQYLLNYLGSKSNAKPPCPQHCCSNCIPPESKDVMTERNPGLPSADRIRTVSSSQRNEIKEALKRYRLHLGRSRRRFGGIDRTTGFTLKLIDSVVAECECLTSVEHVFSRFPIWEKIHAEVIMQVINDVCDE